MSRCYPGNIRFLEEVIGKEKNARLAWHVKRKGLPDPGAGRKGEVFRKKIERANVGFGEVKVPEDAKEPDHRRRVKRFDDTLDLKGDGGEAVKLETMFPVPAPTRSVLYDGFSKEGKGRHLYLWKRKKENPESKYPFPPTSSLEYGWKIVEIVRSDTQKKLPFGRRRLIEDTFYTRTGIPFYL